jgi:hypothetical protein
MATTTTRSGKRKMENLQGAVVEAPAAPSVRTQVNFVSEIEKCDWKVNGEVRHLVASSLYSGIKNQFHCITQNFLYGLTEGSIDDSPHGGVIFVIYYKGDFPCLIYEKPGPTDTIYTSDTEIFNLFWGAMQNVGSNSLVERGEGKREQDFANIKQGSTDGWNICFLNTMSVWIDVPGGTYLQLIPKQPAGGRPKQNQKNKKNIKRKTKKLRKRTTKRKSKRTRKSRKH